MQPHEAVGTTIAGKFRVIALRGRGGMGDVFEVEHAFTKRVGALKVLNKECAAQPAIVERFIREASAAGRIGDPHIVEMLDAGISEQGIPYLFMELLRGASLETLLEQRTRLPIAEALHIILQAANGLTAAHAVQIIHRDIKPANLFILDPEGKRQLKILDFGISKFSGNEVSGLTQTGTAMGTPLYMSFEQLLSSSQVDARTDVYSLAVVLYECITGRVPFNAESLVGLSLALQRGEYAAPLTLRPDVPPALDDLLRRSLSSTREQRPADMRSFAEELSAILGGLQGNASAFSGAETQLIQVAPFPESGLKRATTAAMSSELGARQRPTQGRQATTALLGGAALLLVGSLGYRFLRTPTVEPSLPAALAVSAVAVQPSVPQVNVATASNAAVPATAAQSAAAVELAPVAAVSGAELTAPPGTLPSGAPPNAQASSVPPVVPTLQTLPAATGRAPALNTPSASRPAQATPNPPRAPVATNAGATNPQNTPRSASDRRCARLVERESLGETLTTSERSFLRQSCRAK